MKDFEEFKKVNKIKLASEFIRSVIKDSEWENKVYIAGGYVRDEIMGNEPKDIDLLIDHPDGGIEFADWITKKLGIFRNGSNPVIFSTYGTAKFTLRRVHYKGEDLSDIDIECVMPRKEKYIPGSRNPDVFRGTLEDDAYRRDFAVNSLLKNLTSGEILDLTGMGKDDIKRGIVRTPLDPDTIFQEDPLRMLRAVRFATKYNWDLPMSMIRSIKKNSRKLNEISFERINTELSKMLVSDNPDKAIRLLQFLGLSKWMFIELDKLIGLTQNKYHDSDVITHTLRVLKNTPPDLVTRLAALFHDIGKYKTRTDDEGVIHFYDHEIISAHIARSIMRRLRYDRIIIRDVFDLISNHMRLKQSGNDGIASGRTLRKLKNDMGDNLDKLLDLIHADNLSHAPAHCLPDQVNNIRRKLQELEIKDNNAPVNPPLNGDEIMDMLGIGQGPIVGKLMSKLKDLYLEDSHMTKSEAESIIKKLYKNI